MAKLFSAIGAWVKAHVIASVAIGVGAVAAITTAIVVPVAVSNSGVTVTWLNEDGTELEVDKRVKKGTVPTYDGATPTKAATAQYTYTFKGWDKEVVAVEKENITYKATFSQVVNKYKVTWKNYDGTVLETDENVEYGATPTFDGATPSKAATAKYSYSFEDWDKEITPVTGDQEYVATFTSTINKYTIKFVNYDDTEISSAEVEYDAMPETPETNPTRDDTATEAYDFIGWDSEVTTVTGTTTYKAQYFATPCEFVLVDGNHYEVKGLLNESFDGEIEIPTLWRGVPVTKIQNSAFENKNISAVTLHEGLENIGNNAFFGTYIKSIDIPSSVKSIGTSAFAYTYELVDVTLHEGLEVIGGSAFEYCGIEMLTIPESVTNIYAYAFRHCEGLQLIDVLTAHDGFDNLYGSAFEGCYSVTVIIIRNRLSSESLPSLINYAVDDYALDIFYENTFDESKLGLFSKTAPNKTNHIVGNYYYYRPTGSSSVKYLVGEYGIRNDSSRCIKVTDCEQVKKYACNRHLTLKKIYIGAEVKKLNNFAFDTCTAVSEIEFELGGEDRLDVGQSVFRDTTHNGELVLPDRMKSGNLDSYSFSSIKGVTSFKFETEEDAGYYRTKDGVLYAENGKCLWQYPMGCTATSFTVPAIVTSFMDYNGIRNNNLTEVHFVTKGNITLSSYCLQSTNLSTLTFDPDCTLTLHWFPILSGNLTSLVLPAKTTIKQNALNYINADTHNACNIFFEGSDISSWNSASGKEWYVGKAENCKVYMYSEGAAMDAGDLPTGFAGSWHYVSSTPTIW